MMAPLVRRTWAPRGQTPDFVPGGGRGPREKVSVAAALWLSPRRERLGLYFKTLVNGYFDNWYVTAFLEAMLEAVKEDQQFLRGLYQASELPQPRTLLS